MTPQTEFPRAMGVSGRPTNRTVHAATVKLVSPFRATFRRPISWNFASEARRTNIVSEANSSKSNRAESKILLDYSMAA